MFEIADDDRKVGFRGAVAVLATSQHNRLFRLDMPTWRNGNTQRLLSPEDGTSM